jgi:hypothetical protein
MVAESPIPAEETPAQGKPPVDPFARSSEQQSKDAEQNQQRTENAKIVDALTLEGGITGLQMMPEEYRLSEDLLDATIRANRLLVTGMKGPDDIIFGCIETTDGEVTQNLSLVMPITATRAGADYNGTQLVVKKLETTPRGGQEALEVNYLFGVYGPPEPLLPNQERLSQIKVNGETINLPPASAEPGDPIGSKREVNSKMVLRRNQVYVLSGLTSAIVTTDADGNETTRRHVCTFWVLW